jgi:uncharacterized protein (TIGR03000 family)
MNRTRFAVVACLCSGLALLTPAGTSEGAVYRGFPAYHAMSPYHPVYHPYAPGHMPGWDWRRTYPWSPYNYGRNPYNPAWIPYPVYYPYAYPYPVYAPSTPPAYYSGYSGYTPAADGAMYPSSLGQQVSIPHPTGGYTTPPADAAVIEVRVPSAAAQVEFNGQQTYTTGATRYFVTPSLPAGRGPYAYTVTATWTQNGQSVTRERQVRVARGHTSVVDFTRPGAP